MKALLFRLMYGLGRTPWDSGVTPPEVRAAFEAGDVPPGPGLDLGCGTGTNTVYLAQQGREAVGVDFVPAAIARAREKARAAGVAAHTQFYVADVTRLADLHLPRFAFALDVGCFHGLSPEGQRRYAAGLAGTLQPRALYMLYTLHPRRQVGPAFGVRPEDTATIFRPLFEIRRTEQGGFGARASTWFWMARRT